jgi:hypothetical protein
MVMESVAPYNLTAKIFWQWQQPNQNSYLIVSMQSCEKILL